MVLNTAFNKMLIISAFFLLLKKVTSPNDCGRIFITDGKTGRTMQNGWLSDIL